MSSPSQEAAQPDKEVFRSADGRRALDELFIRLYDRIRQLASRIRWTGTNPTLNPTALAHEAYIKLLRDPPDFASKSYDEVIRLFAHAMRQILVDVARRKSAQKRLPAELPERTNLPVEDALALDAALDELERENPMQARVVQCRFLLGMTLEESAAALGISERTVEREWHVAKAHLRKKLHPFVA